MAMFTREDLFTSGNVMRSSALIKEFCRPGDTPIFCLSPVRDDLPSLQNLYIQYCTDDPTEMTFAEEVFGYVQVWFNLREVTRLKPHLEDWRKICEEKRKSKAFKTIVNEVKEDKPGRLQAAKFLIEEPWKDKRVSKTKREADKTSAKAYNEVHDDLKALQESGFLPDTKH